MATHTITLTDEEEAAFALGHTLPWDEVEYRTGIYVPDALVDALLGAVKV